ncbi:MAG: hypothetical protein WB609_12620 [Candidatus Cybelea sp.]
MANRARDRLVGVALALSCAACNSAVTPAGTVTNARVESRAASRAAMHVYQPLAAGDFWTYTCNNFFKIEDRVVGKYDVGKHATFALSVQIPSSPTKSTKVVELLANDVHGNTWIYGYLVAGKVHAVTAREIVAASPVKGKHYNYPAPKGGAIERIFKEFEATNKTPLGTFWVAAYFESNATHNYGYSLGRGVMEQDHGPNYHYDCLIEKYVLK